MLRSAMAGRPGKKHSVEQILKWADEFFLEHGNYPNTRSGRVSGQGESWSSINIALRVGLRGFQGGSSLRKLLHEHGRVRVRVHRRADLDLRLIVEWADDHFRRHGRYPTCASGHVAASPEDTWSAIDTALAKGSRGLPGGSSITSLLEEHGRKQSLLSRTLLSESLILDWADDHYARTSRYPGYDSGRVLCEPSENWAAIWIALSEGYRGLQGGTSLTRLLESSGRKAVNSMLPALSEEEVLRLADEFYAATGKWPTAASGVLHERAQETWKNVDEALRLGFRGLSGGSSLSTLLEDYGRKRKGQCRPALSEQQVLAWADAYFERAGKLPNTTAGSVQGQPGLTWKAIDSAFRAGVRGLPGGTTLRKFLERHGRVRCVATSE